MGIGPVELALVAVVLLAATAVLLRALTSGRGTRWRAESFARRAGLPAVTPELVRRVGRRRRFVVTGTLLGVAATAVVDLWLVPVYAGLALGAVADALTRPGPPPGTPRVAHATSTRLRDYVPAWVLGTAFAAAAAVGLLALLWVLAPRDGDPPPVPATSGGTVAWMVLAAAAGLAASLGLAGVVVRRRQPAAGPDDLAVDDALRAQAVRDVLHVTAVASFTAGWVVSLALHDADITGVARPIGGAYPLVLLVGLAVVSFAAEFSGSPRRRPRLVGA